VTPTIRRNSRRAATRRGVTLVEMLVTVAVLVIIMTVLVQIFQAATGALSAAQVIQDLDNQVKLMETTIRSDLEGATARFTPPLDPDNGQGYFEYIENEFADNQGEDSDDCLRFTAKAPPGQPFTGRMWVTQSTPAIAGAQANSFYNANAQPVTVTSENAEIIYFLRNGNLYRRVLLIAPELQPAIVPSVGNQMFLPSLGPNGSQPFQPLALGAVNVSWQGVNDLSAHPATTGPNTNVNANAGAFAAQTVVLNTLGSLTNRENRFAAPRFSDDFLTITNTGTYTAGPDGFSDDINGDKVADLYPSLYPNVFNTGLVTAPNYTVSAPAVFLAFPYIFPGAYSRPQVVSADQFGWIHSPTPYANVIQADGNGQAMTFEQSPLQYLQSINHNPLDLADNLPTPTTPQITHGNINGAQMQQTWWGFPTWRETLSQNWNDPTRQVNDGINFTAGFGQPNGLTPRPTNVPPAAPAVADDSQLLPWVGVPLTVAQGGTFPNNYDFSIIRRTPQLFSDAQGYSGVMSVFLGTGGVVDPVWAVSWEDDLVMTNVRSFDVKAYDNSFGGYADLGWGDDVRLYAPYQNDLGFNPQGFALTTTPPYLAGTPNINGLPVTVWPPLVAGGGYNTLTQTLAHEGRMPPITNDLRFDSQFGVAANYLPGGASSTFLKVNNGNYNNGNVGDDAQNVVRMRRVWDSWSVEYSTAPAKGLNVTTGYQTGPPYAPPIYPSYPPPYQAPLRGIQIQIRVADPANQRVKSLTIRQDFTDKL
jgi:prepilin-type N-terminal cleavage/methylation domain-containing protein